MKLTRRACYMSLLMLGCMPNIQSMKLSPKIEQVLENELITTAVAWENCTSVEEKLALISSLEKAMAPIIKKYETNQKPLVHDYLATHDLFKTLRTNFWKEVWHDSKCPKKQELKESIHTMVMFFLETIIRSPGLDLPKNADNIRYVTVVAPENVLLSQRHHLWQAMLFCALKPHSAYLNETALTTTIKILLDTKPSTLEKFLDPTKDCCDEICSLLLALQTCSHTPESNLQQVDLAIIEYVCRKGYKSWMLDKTTPSTSIKIHSFYLPKETPLRKRLIQFAQENTRKHAQQYPWRDMLLKTLTEQYKDQTTRTKAIKAILGAHPENLSRQIHAFEKFLDPTKKYTKERLDEFLREICAILKVIRNTTDNPDGAHALVYQALIGYLLHRGYKSWTDKVWKSNSQ